MRCQDYMKELNYEKKMNSEVVQHNDFLRTIATQKVDKPDKSRIKYSNVVANTPNKVENFRLIVKPTKINLKQMHLD